MLASPMVSPMAHAFTIEDGSGQYGVQKFNLEEQARNFRTGKVETSTTKSEWETPAGKMQFGVQGGPNFGGSGAAYRRHFDRMLTPPQMQDR